MICSDDVALLRQHIGDWRIAQKKIAFVPTMGNLHDGHLSLVEQAKKVADKVVVSIFINPLQFNDKQDLLEYPRTLEQDIALLTERECDLVFTPSSETMYPRGIDQQSQIHVPNVEDKLCGRGRPGHFDGVVTVVSKLFNMVQPDIAVFGEKDYQQLCLIRQLVEDFNLPIEVVGVPICREQSGLAMSSRNNRLSSEQHQQAAMIYQQLSSIKAALIKGESDHDDLIQQATQALTQHGFEPEYVEIYRSDLQPADVRVDKDLRIFIAAKLSGVRLIDNLACQLA